MAITLLRLVELNELPQGRPCDAEASREVASSNSHLSAPQESHQSLRLVPVVTLLDERPQWVWAS